MGMKFIKGIIRLVPFAAIAYGVYHFFFAGPEDLPKVVEGDYQRTLGDLKEQSEAFRSQLVTAAVVRKQLPEQDLEHYIACMEDFTANKLKDLSFDEVFQWCVDESEADPASFISHGYGQSEADFIRNAFEACQSYITENLTAPASADHPSSPSDYVKHGKGRYTISAYVDAQNAFGAMLRQNYICDVTFVGRQPWRPEDWRLESLEMQP